MSRGVRYVIAALVVIVASFILLAIHLFGWRRPLMLPRRLSMPSSR